MCETKRDNQREERGVRKFLGKWRKDDGNVLVTMTEKDGKVCVALNGCFNTVEAVMINGEEICFSWSNFEGKSWGPARFTWLNENTILENQHNIFRRQEPENFDDLKKADTTPPIQCENYRLLPLAPSQIPRASLSEKDVLDFKRNGYLIVRSAASQEMVSRCRRAILADIGSKGLPPNYITQYKSTSFCPTLTSDDEASKPLKEVFRQSSLPGIILDLIGPTLNYLDHSPQIAIVWPQPEAQNERRQIAKHAHIDGIASPTNHLAPGQIHGFSILCGISLSNQYEEFSGSLVVYPTSHTLVNEVLNKQWSKQEELDIPENSRKLGPGQWSWSNENAIPNNILDSIEPVQVLLNKGDAIIAHHQLCHSVSQNFSDDLRIQLYYRIKHVEYDRVVSLLNLWKDFNSITTRNVV